MAPGAGVSDGEITEYIRKEALPEPGGRDPGWSESPDRSRHTAGRAWRLGPDQSQETLGTGVLKITGGCTPVW